MRNLKKFIALIVTLVMITTFAIPAFAATPADVVGTDYEGAVTRLVALGVITGYPTGEFGPDDSITRAQFATVVVRALGYDDVATASQGITKFTDVAANHWASGYINLAVSLGIIKGNPDGTFLPDEPVLYEQAVTMIVRALGMEYYAENKGGYPSGYMLQAKIIGFTDDVAGISGTAATRGIVALLVDNAKDEPIYEQTVFGDDPEYSESDETFLTRLGISLLADDYVVTQTPKSNNLDEGTFVAAGEDEDGNDDEVTFTIVEGAVDIESLLGKQVDIWGEDADTVILVENITGIQLTVTDVVYYNAATNVLHLDLSDGSDDEEFKISEYAGIYKDLFLMKSDSAIDTAMEDLKLASDTSTVRIKINLVLNDDDEIIYLNGIEFDATKDKQLSADPVENTVSDYIKIFTGFYIRYDGDDAGMVVIEKNGEIVDWTALKENDVLFISGDGDADDIEDARIYISASSQTVEGTLSAARDSSSAAADLKIEGTWYDVSTFISSIDVSDVMGEEILAYIDPAGDVYAIDEVEDTTSTDKYGVVLGYGYEQSLGDVVYKVKLLTSSGDEIIYTIDEDEDETEAFCAAFDTNLDNALVTYDLDSSGYIDEISAATEGENETAEFDTSGLKFNGVGLAEDVVIFCDDDVLGLEDIEDDEDATSAWYVVDEDDDEIVAILLTNYESAESDTAYAYVSDFEETDDGYTADVITIDGEATYAIDSDEAQVPDEGMILQYTLNSSDEMTNVDDVMVTATGYITSLSTNRIKIDTDSNLTDSVTDIETYYYADDVLFILDEDGDGSGEAITKSELYEDMGVEIYVVDDEVVAVIAITF